MTYQLQADQKVALTLTVPGIIPDLEVIGPNAATVLKEQPRFATTTHIFTAGAAGIYTVRITPDRDGGTYSVRLVDISNARLEQVSPPQRTWDCADEPILPSGTPPNADTTADDDGCPATSGQFSVESSAREMTYQLQADQKVALTLTVPGIIPDLEVIGPNAATVLKEQPRFATTTHIFTAGAAGIYTVRITPDRDGGTYSVRLVDIS